MNAVILAGGEGTRLRPLTLEKPKPMVPLFGRPVLEHILLLLRKNGFDRVAITLRYLPQSVKDYFGDGSAWGMDLTYFEEREPLGTAGSVKQAEAFVGDEDFLVISGDCICDFDLRECFARHKERGAEATLLLHREKDPLEYGLVQLSEDGRVERFLEKPGWGQVFTNLVNTGIYFLSPSVLGEIPENQSYDFSRDLFPKLLAAGKPLCGDTPYGYWRDMGDIAAYLQTAADALDGKVHLDLLLPQVRSGVWSGSPIPESAAVVPPCWIDQQVTIGEHCLIGPHTVLEKGSFLGDRVVAQRSVLLGAAAGNDTALHGAILCEGSAAGVGCVLGEGAVLGAEATLGDHVLLREEVRIWPRIPVETDSRLKSSLTEGTQPHRAVFEGGAIRGIVARDLTPELLLTLGNILGREGRVALGATPGPGSAALLMAAAAGISAAGGTPWLQDGTTWGSAAYLAAQGQAERSLFIEVKGEQGRLWVMDRDGQPLSSDQRRRLEGSLHRQELRRAPAKAIGRQEWAKGIDAAYCARGVQQAGTGPVRPIQVCVPRRGRENRLLIQALQSMGCQVLSERVPGVCSLWTSHGGRLLFGETEEGNPLSPEQLLLIAVLLLVDAGEARIALPWDAPAACDVLLQRLGAALVRPEDPEYAQLQREQYALRDGLFAACLICHRLGRTGERLGNLAQSVPAFGTFREELELEGSRGDLMEQLSRQWSVTRSGGDGMRFRLSGGWVWLRPAAGRSAIRIRTEGDTVELAAELCDFVRTQAQKLDRGEK